MSWLERIITRRRVTHVMARHITVEDAGIAYSAAIDAAERRHNAAVEAANRQHARALARIETARARAEDVLRAALDVAGSVLAEQRQTALGELDEDLRHATGAVPEAYVSALRADGIVELRVDRFGPPVACLGRAAEGFVVDVPDKGRSFVGSLVQARAALWSAARPPTGRP